MCGIAGFLVRGAVSADCAADILKKMTTAIEHRGPDDEGQWWNAEAGVGLGMRRLAIIDISPAGHQPMMSACGRYVLVFNGEIYNHKQIRKDLEARLLAPVWKGESDTEVLLAAISAFGLRRALECANGMFALALWDKESRTLELAIDRFGEKPLYYGFSKGTFLFGSELKALRVHPDWVGEIDRSALHLLARHVYIPAPHCIYKGFAKLEPGQILTVHPSLELVTDFYWSSLSAAINGLENPIQASESEAVDEFERILSDAVGLRMEADVPLGAFLSGGFDSTAIVAMMQQKSSQPTRTFTIGFETRAYDEAPFARAIAKHLGTNHTELYVTAREAMSVIPSLPAIYDEPFADSSQIPTLLVSKMAKQHVTVALSGDGGDELFGGYQRYFVSERILPQVVRWPLAIRLAVAAGIEKFGAENWQRTYQAATLGKGKMLVGERALKLASLIKEPSFIEGYRNLISSWDRPHDLVLNGNSKSLLFDEVAIASMSSIEKMMYLDLMTYLPGDILTKVDRASMAVSLEARVPFLDHRVFEFAWKLPLSYKVGRGQGKKIVRSLVYRHVPRKFMDRPKTGFGIPIDEWLRGPLRDWAQTLLSEKNIASSGYFDPKIVQQTWNEHLSGKRNRQAKLWPILMFESWLAHVR